MILSEERLGKAFNSVPVRSTDAGASWQRGSYLNCPTNATHGLGEPSVAIVPGSTGDSARAQLTAELAPKDDVQCQKRI